MPVDLESRETRQSAIRSILRRSVVRRQDELVARLARLGFEVTQSSVSRDLRELGATKHGGRYIVVAVEKEEGEMAEMAAFLRSVKTAGPHLTVLQTTVGTAQAVGVALDRSGWHELVGSVAGDDTVFLATSRARDQTRLVRRLRALLANAPRGAAGIGRIRR